MTTPTNTPTPKQFQQLAADLAAREISPEQFNERLKKMNAQLGNEHRRRPDTDNRPRATVPTVDPPALKSSPATLIEIAVIVAALGFALLARDHLGPVDAMLIGLLIGKCCFNLGAGVTIATAMQHRRQHKQGKASIDPSQKHHPTASNVQF